MRLAIDFIKNEKYQLVFYVLLLIAFVFRIYGIDSYRGIDESYEVKRALNALNGEFKVKFTMSLLFISILSYLLSISR